MKVIPDTPNETMRLAALKQLGILDTAREQDFDNITLLATQITGAPMATISLVDENRQWFKSKQGLAISETPRDISFCTYTIRQPGIMIVPDALQDDRFKDNPIVTGEPFIRFYAGVPIRTEDGFVLGTLCIIDLVPRTLTTQQVFALEVLARQVETLFELRTKIAARKTADEKLVALNNHFRLALEKIGDNVWEYDFTTGISTFSQNENEVLGFGTNEFTDNNKLWWQCIYPDDRAMLQENDRKCRSGIIDSHILEYRMIHKDGSVKWVLDRGVVIEKTPDGLPLKIIGTHTDITTRKKNEQALLESEKRWKFALEGSGDGVWDWDVKAGKVFYSKRWKEMLGYAGDEIGDELTAWESRVHKDDLAKVYHELQLHFSGEFPFFKSEHRMLCKDGTYKWILNRGMVIERDTDNKPLRVIGTHTDVSQRKFTEQALEQRLKQFKSLSDNIPGVIYEYEFRKDGSEGMRYVSPAVTTLFGIQSKEFKNYHAFIHPDDIAMIETKNTISKETLEPFYCEARLVIPGRKVVWHSVTSSFSYWTEDGSKIFTGFMLDITERKKTDEQLRTKEEKYRCIIANMNLGLLEVDKNEKILYANQSFCIMSGYDLEEIVGREPNDIFIFGENKELVKNKNRLRKEGISDAYEIAVRDKRGQLKWWLISGAPRFDDAGVLVGSIGIHLDITTQKKTETDLIEARELAEGSTRSKEIFLANMSHEIRTPMNAITGMAAQLAKTNLNSTQQFYLDTIHSASENLLVIINDILDISKIEAGKLQLEKIGFEPAEMISRAIRVMNHKAEEKGLALTLSDCDTGIAPVLMGDPFRLNQVLLNLINNSIKFTEKGGVQISCNVVKCSLHTQTIRIAVKDTGIGMEERFVGDLFQKFSQEDASVTRRHGGTGLGMSICKELVELMGGKIIVDSKKGVGTTVSFIIEFEKGDSLNLPVKQTFTFDANMLLNKKILVVDDNKMNRLVAAMILKNCGAIITEAVNGQEAVDLLSGTPIDLVLMDIQMPVMDGMQAAGIIRQTISKTLPVIALTANAIKGDNDKCLDAGMNAYLSKPFNEKDLLNMVAFWLNENAPQAMINAGLQQPLYKLETLELHGRTDKGFVQKMVRLFISQTPLRLKEMEQVYQQGDYKAMAVTAVKLKAAFVNMGIVSLQAPMLELETKIRLALADEAIPALLNLINTTISEVSALLQKEPAVLNEI